MEENYTKITSSTNENNTNQDKNVRKEKMITRKGLIITTILLIFVSIFLDLYVVYLTDYDIYKKVFLCIIHPTVFMVFIFLPSGLYIEFNYTENKFIYNQTCLVPCVLNKCTRNEVDMNNIKEFLIFTSKCLCCRRFTLFYRDIYDNLIKITSGRDKNCVSNFSKSVLNIPIKLNHWLKNQDFFENIIIDEEKKIENEHSEIKE